MASKESVAQALIEGPEAFFPEVNAFAAEVFGDLMSDLESIKWSEETAEKWARVSIYAYPEHSTAAFTMKVSGILRLQELSGEIFTDETIASYFGGEDRNAIEVMTNGTLEEYLAKAGCTREGFMEAVDRFLDKKEAADGVND